MQKLKNNEARPKFTDSYFKKACISQIFVFHVVLVPVVCVFPTKCFKLIQSNLASKYFNFIAIFRRQTL